MAKELYIEVTVKKQYLFPLNLRSSDELLVQEFFKDFDINVSHASRDFHHIDYGDRITSIKYKRIKDTEEISNNKGYKSLRVRS